MKFDPVALSDGVRTQVTPDDQFEILRLNTADGRSLIDFRRRIIEALDNKEFLYEEPDEEKFVDTLLGQDGFTIAIMVDTEIAAYTSLFLPEDRIQLESFGFADYVEWHPNVRETVYIAATMVAPAFRGRSFQNILTAARTEVAVHLGRRHHYATAALGNFFSWRNAITNKFLVSDIVHPIDPKYGRLTRYLLHRPRNSPLLIGDPIWIAATDAVEQEQILKCGYLGSTFRSTGGIIQVGYSLQMDRYGPAASRVPSLQAHS